METHRHHGQDILLITQHPNLLDANVRRLVGRHIHVRRVWGWHRAITYEWDQATDPGRLSTATKGSWRYPRSAFGLYKSATVHTARGQRPPPRVLGYFPGPRSDSLHGVEYLFWASRQAGRISVWCAWCGHYGQRGCVYGAAFIWCGRRRSGSRDGCYPASS